MSDKEEKKQENTPVVKDLQENIRVYKEVFSDCADIKMREMTLGKEQNVGCFVAYIEVTGGSAIFEKSMIGNLLNSLGNCSKEEIWKRLNENALGLSDVSPFETMEEAADGMLTGDTILFVDGYDKALKIPDKGYPGMGVSEADLRIP